MANFNISYKLTKKEEGGYANIKGDNGGETMWGIARNFWGEDKRLRQFWEELDWYKQGMVNYKGSAEYYKRINDLCGNNTIMVKEAESFYKEEFWDKMKGEKIKSQKVANNLFDFFVNAGKNAIKVVQRQLGVEADGIVGDNTLKAINIAGEDFNLQLSLARVDYYKSLKKPQFEKGWLNRANRFK